VKVIELGLDGIDFERWPAFVNELHSIEELEIWSHGALSWHNISPTLSMMPKTLKKLKVSVGFDEEYSFYHKGPDDPYPMKEFVPNLERLETELSIIDTSKWQSHLPDTLTDLHITNWLFDQPLPPNLTRLKLRNGVNRMRPDFVFPSQLAILECFDLHKDTSLIEALPDSLTDLYAIPLDVGGFRPEQLAK
jgi:hypothetical protein